MYMADELLQEVDENDKPIGGVSRKDAKLYGNRYRIIRVIVEDEFGNILIQKRTPNKDTYPNCWDNSAAGHVDEGESYIETARREMAEEIGIADENLSLEKVDYFYSEATTPNGLHLNRFTTVYKVVLPHETKFTPQPEEVSEIKWASVDHVRSLVLKDAEVTDGLKVVFERYYNKSNDENN